MLIVIKRIFPVIYNFACDFIAHKYPRLYLRKRKGRRACVFAWNKPEPQFNYASWPHLRGLVAVWRKKKVSQFSDNSCSRRSHSCVARSKRCQWPLHQILGEAFFEKCCYINLFDTIVDFSRHQPSNAYVPRCYSYTMIRTGRSIRF